MSVCSPPGGNDPPAAAPAGPSEAEAELRREVERLRAEMRALEEKCALEAAHRAGAERERDQALQDAAAAEARRKESQNELHNTLLHTKEYSEAQGRLAAKIAGGTPVKEKKGLFRGSRSAKDKAKALGQAERSRGGAGVCFSARVEGYSSGYPLGARRGGS